MFRKKQIAKKRAVLFVDDEELILRSLERGLLDQSYDKFFAKSGKEALEILKRKKVHVIVTDLRMPEMSGLELLRIVKKEYPDIIGIVLTGYDPDAEVRNAVEQGEIFWLIPKPLWKLGGKFERLIQRALNRSILQNDYETVRQKN
jgi:DNA-binding NtrC family response regulator